MKKVILGNAHHDMNREVTITFTAEELLRLTVCYGKFTDSDENQVLLDSHLINANELPLSGSGYGLYSDLIDLLESMGFKEQE